MNIVLLSTSAGSSNVGEDEEDAAEDTADSLLILTEASTSSFFCVSSLDSVGTAVDDLESALDGVLSGVTTMIKRRHTIWNCDIS